MSSHGVSAEEGEKKKSPPQAAYKNVLADAEWNETKKKGGGRYLHHIIYR